MTSSRRSHTGRLLGVLLVAPFMAQVDATIANVGTPSIHADLRASGAELELVIGGYIVAYAVLLITGARLGQALGYRRVFLAGVAVFTSASLVCGLAPDPGVLIVARVLQGSGAAFMFPQTLTGIQLNFTGGERARAIGLYAIALSAGAVAGQILGGVLISANIAGSHWRSIFLVNVPVGAVLIVLGRRYLPAGESGQARRLDLRGIALLSASIVLVVLPLVLGRSEGWPAWTWLSLGASLPAIAAFVATERRVAARGGAPLVNLRALAQPAISWGLTALAAAVSTYYALLFTLAMYLQQGLGRSALTSGLTLVSWVAAFGLAGQVVRRLPRDRSQLAAPVGGLLLGAAYVAVSVSMLAGEHGEVPLVVLLGAGGLGLGTVFSALIAHLTDSVAPAYAPDISGVSTTMMQIAAAIAIAAFGTVYLAVAAQPGATHASHAFALTTAVLGVVALLAAGAARRSTRPATEHRVIARPVTERCG